MKNTPDYRQKRSYIIGVVGMALVVAGYFGFPALFGYLKRPSAFKHTDVSTAKVDAVHVATSDPRVTVLILENDGAVTVSVRKMNPNGGDWADISLSVPPDSMNLNLQLSRRTNGVFTMFARSDADGLPTQKAIGANGEYRSYRRQAIEWREAPMDPSIKPKL